MKLAIISDTHLPKGRRVLPDACRRALADADAIVHAGDFVTVEVLEDLRALGPPVHAVQGNVDSEELQAELPETLDLLLAGCRIAVVHDAGPAGGRMRRLRALFPEADAVIFGHSHLPLLEQGPDGMTMFNPGSPTERRRAPAHTMGTGYIRDGRVSFRIVALD